MKHPTGQPPLRTLPLAVLLSVVCTVAAAAPQGPYKLAARHAFDTGGCDMNPRSLALTPDAVVYAGLKTSCDGGYAPVIDTHTGDMVRVLNGFEVVPYDDRVLLNQESGAMQLIEPLTGTIVRTFGGPGSTAPSVLAAKSTIGSDILAVGPGDAAETAATRLLYRVDADSGAIVQRYSLPDANPAVLPGAHWGWAIATSPSRIVLGADRAQESGHVYVLDAATGAVVWDRLSPGLGEADRFGRSVALLPGGDVLVGAPGQPGYVYRFAGASGALVQVYERPARRPWTYGFGWSLAVHGTLVAIGQPYASYEGFSAGNGNTYVIDTESGAVNGSFADIEVEATSGLLSAWHGERLALLGEVAIHDFRLYVMQPSCGDGIPDPCEGCDDGNTDDGDGCSSWCEPESCGDGAINDGEVCDDGNTSDGDGCDRNCRPTGCGNCRPTEGEECDDGNSASGDGCDSNCSLTACGNRIVSPCVEDCDDGNIDQGDGCDFCRSETMSTSPTTSTSSTTTTIVTCATLSCSAGSACWGFICDDSNPCTVDSCNGDRCRNAPLEGADGARCALGVISSACSGELPRGLRRSMTRIRRILDRAERAQRARQSQYLSRRLRKVSRHAQRAAHRAISKAGSGDCHQTLVLAIARARKLAMLFGRATPSGDP